MRNSRLKIIFFCLLIYSVSFCGEDKEKKKSAYEFHQEFIDRQYVPRINSFQENLTFLQNQKNGKKSIFLSGLFSAIIPGAGEFYTEHYIQSGIFLGIEVTSWIMNSHYNNKGDDQTAFFENYANSAWSAVKYTQWISRNLEKFLRLDPNKTETQVQNYLKDITERNLLYINPDASLKSWQRVNFQNINEVERIIGLAFSHVLPGYGEQQYFELIGKYPQFRAGWDDSDPNDNNIYRPKDSLSAHSKWYMVERGKANDYYDMATTCVSIIIANHLVSMLDAVLCAYLYNKAHINMTFEPMRGAFGNITLNPRLNLSVNF
jgi:hypothetical protein